MKKVVFAVGVLCMAGFLVYGYIFLLNQPIRIIIENKFDETMTDVVLSVGSQRFELGEFEPGKRKEKWFFYEGSDSSYHLEGFINGKEKLEQNHGYVTHGMGFERIFMKFRNDGTIYFRDLKRNKG